MIGFGEGRRVEIRHCVAMVQRNPDISRSMPLNAPSDRRASCQTETYPPDGGLHKFKGLNFIRPANFATAASVGGDTAESAGSLRQ